jgi:hypothetical protein
MLVFIGVDRGGRQRVPAEMPNAHAVTITDGIVVRPKEYTDRNEALEAAGLRQCLPTPKA